MEEGWYPTTPFFRYTTVATVNETGYAMRQGHRRLGDSYGHHVEGRRVGEEALNPRSCPQTARDAVATGTIQQIWRGSDLPGQGNMENYRPLVQQFQPKGHMDVGSGAYLAKIRVHERPIPSM